MTAHGGLAEEPEGWNDAPPGGDTLATGDDRPAPRFRRSRLLLLSGVPVGAATVLISSSA